MTKMTTSRVSIQSWTLMDDGIEVDMDDFDSYDEWVSEHVNEHGPTAAGFDALARMEREGFFT